MTAPDYEPELTRRLIDEYWHPVATVAELREFGSWVRFDIGSYNIVIFNDNSKFIAFHNRCPHRGARLFDEDFGVGRIRCRYHGWGYRQGRLIFPSNQLAEECRLDDLDLFHIPVEIFKGFIFISFTPVISLVEQLSEEISERLGVIGSRVETRVDFNRYNFECFWPLAVENALEPYHVPFVHPNTLGQLKLTKGCNTYHRSNSIWRSEVGNNKIENQLQKITSYFVNGDFFPGYESIYFFPFSMISSTFGVSYSLQNFFPSEDKATTRFTSRLFKSALKDEKYTQLADIFMRSTIEVNRKVFSEDHDICKIVPPESWSLEAPKAYRIDEEKVLHFRESCRTAFSSSLGIKETK